MDRDIVETLRGFDLAYPTDIFPEVTPDLDVRAVTRGAASMGRHCAKFMQQGADEISRLRTERETMLRVLKAIASSETIGGVCGWYDEIKAAKEFVANTQSETKKSR